jgi:hypothetical protein
VTGKSVAIRDQNLETGKSITIRDRLRNRNFRKIGCYFVLKSSPFLFFYISVNNFSKNSERAGTTWCQNWLVNQVKRLNWWWKQIICSTFLVNEDKFSLFKKLEMHPNFHLTSWSLTQIKWSPFCFNPNPSTIPILFGLPLLNGTSLVGHHVSSVAFHHWFTKRPPCISLTPPAVAVTSSRELDYLAFLNLCFEIEKPQNRKA